MIKLHHLKIGRSIFMAWQLEELGLDYEVVFYQRDSAFRAPASLKEIHPLGKSPVIEDQGMVIAESGAITSYLLSSYDKEHNWSPAPENVAEWTEFTQWLHYPEGSAFAPLLMSMLLMQEEKKEGLIKNFADAEVALHFDYISKQLAANDYLLGAKMTAADFGVGYIASMANSLGMLANYPAIKAYAERLMVRPAFVRAIEKVGQ